MYWPKIDPKKAKEIEKFILEVPDRIKKIERNSVDATTS